MISQDTNDHITGELKITVNCFFKYLAGFEAVMGFLQIIAKIFSHSCLTRLGRRVFLPVRSIFEVFFKKNFKDDYFRRFLKIKPSTTIIFRRFAKSRKRCFFKGFGHFSCHFFTIQGQKQQFFKEKCQLTNIFNCFLAIFQLFLLKNAEPDNQNLKKYF